MEISVIDNLLVRHPLLKNLTEADRINIYNQVYSEIYQTRAEIIPLYEPATDDRTELIPKITGDLTAVNLSAIKNVDNLLNEHELFENLTVNERIAVYKMVQHQLNLYRSFLHHQEYFFATIKADMREYKTFTIIPELVYNITNMPINTQSLYYTPDISYDVTAITLLSSNTYYTPSIVYALTPYSQSARNIYLDPTLTYSVTINPADQLRDMNFIPSLSYSFFTSPLKQDLMTLEPSIAYNLMLSDANYDFGRDFNLEPTLTYEIESGV
jgi:hypothetical protein